MYKIRKSNIVKIGYEISGEIVPWVRISGEIVPRVRFLQRNRTHSIWVRFLLGTISPGYDFSWHPNKAPYNKNLRQARIRWLWHLWFPVILANFDHDN